MHLKVLYCLHNDEVTLPVWFQKVEVEAPPGQIVGYAKQAWSVCKPKYKIQNAEGDTVLRVEGPCFTCAICGDVEFQVRMLSH